MTTEREGTEDARNRRAAVEAALSELPGEDGVTAEEAVDGRWLRVGLRLGLERPHLARGLLELYPARAAAADSPEEGAEPAAGAVEPVPVCSMLLARAAAMPASERVGLEPEALFGWAARLTPAEVLWMGQVVSDMLAAGSPPDVARGFGLTWDAGVRLPRQELESMFAEFAELEITIGGVLAGRDLRAARPRPPRPTGLGALLAPFQPRTRLAETEANDALERRGELAQRGLVAAWNAWVAMRYRAHIPAPTFELLTRAWVTAVGPLPAL